MKPMKRRAGKRRVDWIGIGCLSAILAVLLWLCVAAVRQARHIKALRDAINAQNTMQVKTFLDTGTYAQEEVNSMLAPTVGKLYYSNDIEILRLLLQHRANPDFIDEGGCLPPLSVAIWSGKLSAVQLLLNYGANPNRGGAYRSLPALAIQQQHSQIARALLMKGADVHGKDDQERSLLHNCILVDDAATAKVLLEKGVNPNAKIGRTMALCVALDTGKSSVARELILHGANIQAIKSDGHLALYPARKRRLKAIMTPPAP